MSENGVAPRQKERPSDAIEEGGKDRGLIVGLAFPSVSVCSRLYLSQGPEKVSP